MGAAGRLVVAGLGALLGNMLFPGKGGQIGFAIGSILGSLLFPKARDYGPEKIANLQFQTTAKGTPLQVVYGRQRVAGNIIWYGNFRTIRDSGGKGGKGGAGGKGGSEDVRYTASFAVGISEGIIDHAHRIWSNKTLVDLVRYGSQITIYKGNEVQVADPTISAATQGVGAVQPLRSDSRIINGTAPSASLSFVPVLVGSEQVYYYDSSLIVGGARGRVLLARVASAPAQNQYTIDYDTGRVTFGGTYTNITMFFSYRQSLIGVQDAVGYRYVAYAVFKDWDLGGSTTIPNFTFEITRRARVVQDDAIGLITSQTNIDRRVPDTGTLITSYNPGGDGASFHGKYKFIAGVIGGSTLQVRDAVTGALLHSQSLAGINSVSRVLEVRPSGVIVGGQMVAGNTRFNVFSWSGPNGDQLTLAWSVDVGDGFWSNGYDADLDDKFVYLVAGPNRRLWIYARDPDSSGNPVLIRGPLFINRTGIDAVGITEAGEAITGVMLESGLLYVYWALNTLADGSNGEIRVYDMSGRTTDTPGLMKFGAAIAVGGATSNVMPLLDTWTGLQNFFFTLGADPAIPQMTIVIAGDFLYVNKQNTAKTLVKCFKLSDKTLKWSQTGGDFVGLIWGTNGAKSSTAEGDQNLAWIAYDALTNTRYGAGVAKAKVDMVSFAEASEHFAKHKLFLSPVIKDRASLLKHIEGMLVLVDCFFYFSEGKFKLRVRKEETAPRTLTTAAYALGDVAVSREGSSDIVNRVLVHYTNRANEYTPETAEAKDDWLVGRREGAELEVGGESITNPAHARKLAYRILWTRSYKRMAAHIPMGPQDGDIEPSDVVAWTDADLSLASKKMRVIGISEEDDGRTGVDVVEENDNILDWHEYPQAEFAVPVVPQPRGQAVHTYLDVMELPPVPVNGNPSLVMIVAGMDRSWVGARLYASNDNATYTRIAQVTQGTIWGVTKTTLAATQSQFEDTVNTVDVEILTPDATLLAVTDVQWRAGVNKILVKKEVIYFKTATLVSGQRYTLSNLLRGMDLTSAAAHVAEEGAVLLNQYVVVVTPVRGTLPRLGLQPVQSMAIDWTMVDRTIYFKAASINVMGEEQSLADVQPISITYKATGGMPTRANNLRVQQEYQPPFPALDVVDEWNRGDNLSLGTDWTEDENSTEALRITSSTLRHIGTANGFAYWDVNTPLANQYVEFTLVTPIAQGGGIAARIQTGTVRSSFSAYGIMIGTFGGADLLIRLVKWVGHNLGFGDDWVTLATGPTAVAGDKLRLEIRGTALKVLRNGADLFNVVDATYSAAGLGVGVVTQNSNGQTISDSWKGGNIAPDIASFPMGTGDTLVTVRVASNRDIVLVWGYTDVSIQEDAELERGVPDGRDPAFQAHRIKVYFGAALKRTEEVTTELYRYTEAKHLADNGSIGSPKFEVTIVDRNGGESEVVTLGPLTVGTFGP
jgi:hypothetical protein